MSDSELKDRVSDHRSATLPEALARNCLAQNMRKDVPGSDWKGKWRFPLDVRSGFGWIIPTLLIVFKARPALMAWRGARAHVGWWLPAHGKAFSYFPPCATVAKVSGRSRGSGGVVGNAWLTETKWSRRWRVSAFQKSWIWRRWRLSQSHTIQTHFNQMSIWIDVLFLCLLHTWLECQCCEARALNYQLFCRGHRFLKQLDF